jgi:threonine/homoserine/homoserine lactone efflux protein
VVNKYKKIFGAGLAISFLGSLPPGLLNILAVQISDQQGFYPAFTYAAGATLAEMITVRVVLSAMNWLNRQKHFFAILEWLTATFLLLFATACFMAAVSIQDPGKLIPQILLPPFVTGFLFSLLNPLHIPFWLGWSGYLYSNGSLKKETVQYNWFVAGIGLGTMAGFLIYIPGGIYLFAAIQQNRMLVNMLFGMILLGAAVLHIRKMIRTALQMRYAGMRRTGGPGSV